MKHILALLFFAASAMAQYSFNPELITVTESASGFKDYTFSLRNPTTGPDVQVVAVYFVQPNTYLSRVNGCMPLFAVNDLYRRSIQGVDQAGNAYYYLWGPGAKGIVKTADPCEFDLEGIKVETNTIDLFNFKLTIRVRLLPGGPTEAWLFANNSLYGYVFQPWMCNGINIGGSGSNSGCPKVTPTAKTSAVSRTARVGDFIGGPSMDGVGAALDAIRNTPLRLERE